MTDQESRPGTRETRTPRLGKPETGPHRMDPSLVGAVRCWAQNRTKTGPTPDQHQSRSQPSLLITMTRSQPSRRPDLVHETGPDTILVRFAGPVCTAPAGFASLESLGTVRLFPGLVGWWLSLNCFKVIPTTMASQRWWKIPLSAVNLSSGSQSTWLLGKLIG